MHIVRRGEIPFVHPQVAPAITHHHVAVSSQATPRDAAQPERTETNEQLVGVAWRRVELERELRRVVPAEPEDGSQRTKHFTGPATKSR